MAEEYLTAAEIAAGTGLAVVTIYSMASRDKWDRTRLRPRRYRMADVFATLKRIDATRESSGVAS